MIWVEAFGAAAWVVLIWWWLWGDAADWGEPDFSRRRELRDDADLAESA